MTIKGLLSTYEVICVSCGLKKYPTLPFRPADYVCVLCRAVGAEKRARRLSGAAKRQKPRPCVAKDPTEAKEETP